MQTTADVYIHRKSSPKAKNCHPSIGSRDPVCLYAANPRLNTALVNSVWMTEAVVGSLWVPIRINVADDNAQMEKATCAYMNSTLGWISMIGVASSSNLSRLAVSIDAMRRIPVPQLTPDQAAAIAEAFDELADTVLEPLRYAATDEARIGSMMLWRMLWG